MDYNKTGKFIYKLRKDHSLTQQEFAALFGVTYQAVSKWENGKNIPDILILNEIAKKFDVDINEILNGKEATKKIPNLTLKILIGIFITVILVWGFLKRNNNNFEFKKIISVSDNFEIIGSVAYNHQKTSIFISDIKYKGISDNTIYKEIECVLYEYNKNIEIKIQKHVNGYQLSLKDYLNNVKFNVENYKYVCSKISKSQFFLVINATNQDDQIIVYKIPIKLKKVCQ